MSLVGMIPVQYRAGLLVVGVVLLAGAAAGVTWWGLAPRIELQAQRAGHAEADLAGAQALVDLQAGVLEQQQKMLGQLAEVDRQIKLLGQTITRNATAQAVAIEELKRNDEETRVYLAGPVPAALGRLYERPETTDPAAYHAPAGVQPSAVRAAGESAAGSQ